MTNKEREFPEPLVYHPTWDVEDSTKTNAFLECPRKYFYEYVLGWRPSGAKQDLIFGQAWHEAMEILLLEGYGEEGLLKAAQAFLAEYRLTFGEHTDDIYAPKNPGSAMVALSKYAKVYADDLRKYRVLYTEVAGAVPVIADKEIHFRFDGLLEDKATGLKFIMEHKTTKRGGRTWVDQWSLSMQIGTYTHALYCLYGPEESYGVRVNGAIFTKEPSFTRVPCKKDIDSMNVWHSTMAYIIQSKDNEFQKLSEAGKKDRCLDAFPLNPTACTKYWGCPYHDFCTSWSNPLRRCDTVPDGFDIFRWDPNDRPSKAILSINDAGLAKMVLK